MSLDALVDVAAGTLSFSTHPTPHLPSARPANCILSSPSSGAVALLTDSADVQFAASGAPSLSLLAFSPIHAAVGDTRIAAPQAARDRGSSERAPPRSHSSEDDALVDCFAFGPPAPTAGSDSPKDPLSVLSPLPARLLAVGTHSCRVLVFDLTRKGYPLVENYRIPFLPHHLAFTSPLTPSPAKQAQLVVAGATGIAILSTPLEVPASPLTPLSKLSIVLPAPPSLSGPTLPLSQLSYILAGISVSVLDIFGPLIAFGTHCGRVGCISLPSSIGTTSSAAAPTIHEHPPGQAPFFTPTASCTPPCRWLLEGGSPSPTKITSLAFSPSGRFLAFASWDGQVRIAWNPLAHEHGASKEGWCILQQGFFFMGDLPKAIETAPGALLSWAAREPSRLVPTSASGGGVDRFPAELCEVLAVTNYAGRLLVVDVHYFCVPDLHAFIEAPCAEEPTRATAAPKLAVRQVSLPHPGGVKGVCFSRLPDVGLCILAYTRNGSIVSVPYDGLRILPANHLACNENWLAALAPWKVALLRSPPASRRLLLHCSIGCVVALCSLSTLLIQWSEGSPPGASVCVEATDAGFLPLGRLQPKHVCISVEWVAVAWSGLVYVYSRHGAGRWCSTALAAEVESLQVSPSSDHVLRVVLRSGASKVLHMTVTRAAETGVPAIVNSDLEELS